MPCRQVITMDTDHSPFYSAPDHLAAHLLAIAANRSKVNRVRSPEDGELPHVGAR
jgi:LmbE family N-acetylglucosaminyl deacetylase